MYRLRRATVVDLPEIHRMQDTPERETILVSPLPSRSEFITKTENEMREGREHYAILESDHGPAGFLWILVPDESCEIWGRHLRTLFHACAWFAFEKLKLPSLSWCVRLSNKRFISVCELFRIRKTGEDFLCNIGEKFEFMAVGPVNYYQFSAGEYFARIPLLEQYSMGSSIFFKDALDNQIVVSGGA
jgi:hypothetical protein